MTKRKIIMIPWSVNMVLYVWGFHDGLPRRQHFQPHEKA